MPLPPRLRVLAIAGDISGISVLLDEDKGRNDDDEGDQDESTLLINSRDADGMTMLHLAVVNGHVDLADYLLKRGALHRIRSTFGFTALDEALEHEDVDCVAVLIYHVYQRNYHRFTDKVESLCTRLEESMPDMSVDLHWAFKTWIPLVSRMCPNDTFKIYKHGSKVRMDVTLVGFDKLKWQRGNISFIFGGRGKEHEVLMIDRDNQTWGDMLEPMRTLTREKAVEEAKEMIKSVRKGGGAKAVSTDVESRGVTYARKKKWISGSDVTEVVDGFECDVYECKGLSFGAKWRTSKNKDKDKNKRENDIDSDSEDSESEGEGEGVSVENENDIDYEEIRRQLEAPPPIDEQCEPDINIEICDESPSSASANVKCDSDNDSDDDEFFDAEEGEGEGDVENGAVSVSEGKDEEKEEAKEEEEEEEFQDAQEVIEGEGEAESAATETSVLGFSRVLKFNLWMSEEFPVSIGDILPIIEILAPTSKHFSKLNNFLNLRLPPGFPVKIEVPILPSLSAVVTFLNYSGGSHIFNDGDGFFEVPDGYVYRAVDADSDSDSEIDDAKKKRKKKKKSKKKKDSNS